MSIELPVETYSALFSGLIDIREASTKKHVATSMAPYANEIVTALNSMNALKGYEACMRVVGQWHLRMQEHYKESRSNEECAKLLRQMCNEWNECVVPLSPELQASN